MSESGSEYINKNMYINIYIHTCVVCVGKGTVRGQTAADGRVAWQGGGKYEYAGVSLMEIPRCFSSRGNSMLMEKSTKGKTQVPLQTASA